MRTHSKTPLFLMELIIMLLVFSVSAAICLQVFSGAKKISDESRKLDIAVMQAQTVAECWKASYGDLEETAERMGVVAERNRFVIYDDDSELYIEAVSENTTLDITIFSEETEVFSLLCEAVMKNG